MLHIVERKHIDGVSGEFARGIGTKHHHIVALAVDGQIARHGQGIQQGDMVTGNRVGTWRPHLTHHRKLKVDKLHGHHGVVDQIAVNQFRLDVSRQFIACLASSLHRA